jgi:hypothetical protein
MDRDEISDDDDAVIATARIGEHLRTWRKFLAVVRWSVGAAAVALLALLIFCTHT